MKSFLYHTRSNFFGDNIIQPLRPKVYTVVVLYHNGYKKEYQGIENAWRYIKKVKKNPIVSGAWIKQ